MSLASRVQERINTGQRIPPPQFLDRSSLKQLKDSSSPPLFRTFSLQYILKPAARFVDRIVPSSIGSTALFLLINISTLIISLVCSLIIFHARAHPTYLLAITSICSFLSAISFPLSISHANKIRRTTPVLYLAQSLFQAPLVCLFALFFSIASVDNYSNISLIHVMVAGLYQQSITIRRLVTLTESREVPRIVIGNSADVLVLFSVISLFSIFTEHLLLHLTVLVGFFFGILVHVYKSIIIDKQHSVVYLAAVKRCISKLIPLLSLYLFTSLWAFFDQNSETSAVLYGVVISTFTSTIASKLELHRQSGSSFYIAQPIILLAVLGFSSAFCYQKYGFYFILSTHSLMILTLIITIGVLVQYISSVLKEFAKSLHQSVLELDVVYAQNK
ncbi:hypothetical protein P9112_012619 [Eukaryota sp. TZLM1-RC]